jgi:AAA15 family ATPase/GTPase
MLIRFVVKNFLSFKDETEFNMLTGDVRRHPGHVFPFPKVDVLKSAAIYGANGAGRSNLVLAMNFLSIMVTEGYTDIFDDDLSFKLSDDGLQPSMLEVEFIIDGLGFAYGISFKKNKIDEEWLYGLNYGKKDDVMIFERKMTAAGLTKISMAAKYLKTQKDKVLIQVHEEDLLEGNVEG